MTQWIIFCKDSKKGGLIWCKGQIIDSFQRFMKCLDIWLEKLPWLQLSWLNRVGAVENRVEWYTLFTYWYAEI